MARRVQIQLRRDTAANFTSVNPTLAAGEPGYETDTGKLKIGDGATAWNALGYFLPSASPLTTKGDLYGHSGADARVPIGTDGFVLTADSAQALGLGWVAPGTITPGTGLVLLFDSTLGAAAATIDTGAGGIPAGHGDLVISIMGRSSLAATRSGFGFRFNNDSGANYDSLMNRNVGGAFSSSSAIAATSGQVGVLPAATATANYPGIYQCWVPSYDQTTFYKVLTASGGGVTDTLAQSNANMGVGSWRNTAAITRITIIDTSAANFLTGTRVTIWGTK